MLLRRMCWIQIRIWWRIIRLWKRWIKWRGMLRNNAHSWIILIRIFSRTLVKVWIPYWSSITIKLRRGHFLLVLVMNILLIRMKSLLFQFWFYFLLRLFFVLTWLKSWLLSFLFNFFLFLFLTIVLFQIHQKLKSLFDFIYIWNYFSFNFLWLFEHIIDFFL